MKKILIILLSIVLIVIPIIVLAETVDTTPAVINSMSFSNTTIEAGTNTTITMDAYDDISGISNMFMTFVPVGSNTTNYNDYLNFSVYNIENGNHQYTVHVNDDVKSGEYEIRNISMYDYAKNETLLKNPKLSFYTAGLTYNDINFNIPNITIINNKVSDTTAPILNSVKIESNEIQNGDLVKITLNVSDDTGVNAIIAFYNNSLQVSTGSFTDLGNGNYEITEKVYNNGTYNLEGIIIKDMNNNTSTYSYIGSPDYYLSYGDGSVIQKVLEPNSLDFIVSGEEDKTAPTLNNITFSKTEFSVPSLLDIVINYNDNKPKDILTTNILIYDKSTGETSNIHCTEGHKYTDYTDTCMITFNQYQKSGEYYIEEISLQDSSHNKSTYSYSKGTLPYYSFKIIEETKADVTTSTNNSEATTLINNANDNAVIKIDSSRNRVISKDFFDSIKGTNKKIMVETNGITWIFNGNDIVNDTKDVNTNVSIYLNSDTSVDSDLSNKLSDTSSVVISFYPNGLLPGKCKIRVKADYTLRNYVGIENLMVYYYDEDSGLFDPVATKISLTDDGYYEFYITHNSTFIISNNMPKKEYISSNTQLLEINSEEDTNYEINEENVIEVINGETNEISNNTTDNQNNKLFYYIITTIVILLIIAGSVTYYLVQIKKVR